MKDKIIKISIVSMLGISCLLNLFLLLNYLPKEKPSLNSSMCTPFGTSGCCILPTGVVSCGSIIDN